MFYIPMAKARVKLVLTAEVELDPDSEIPAEQQIDKLLKHLCEFPQEFNKYAYEQVFEGEVFEEKI